MHTNVAYHETYPNGGIGGEFSQYPKYQTRMHIGPFGRTMRMGEYPFGANLHDYVACIWHRPTHLPASLYRIWNVLFLERYSPKKAGGEGRWDCMSVGLGGVWLT